MEVNNQYQIPRMMTIRQIAKTGLLPENALRRMVNTGEIPSIKVGKKNLINYERLVEMLNKW